MDSQSDEADTLAMARLQAGDDLALNEIVQRWKTPLASYLARQLGSHDDAIDLTMETFVRIYQSRSRYGRSARFAHWLFTIATNLAKNHRRWKERHPEIPLETDGDESLASARRLIDPALTPAQELVKKERAQAVQQAIAALPPDLRTAILLFEYQDLSHAEIGAIEGCSAKAVETRLYRARQSLERTLSHLLREK